MIEIAARVQWIKEECGGRRHPAEIGYRPVIRWVRHGDKFPSGHLSAQVQEMVDTDHADVSIVRLSFFVEDGVPEDWLASGERIELTEVYKVVAVGVIV